MSIEMIKTMLKEFDYDKNTLEDTIEFLCYMTSELIKIQEREDK